MSIRHATLPCCISCVIYGPGFFSHRHFYVFQSVPNSPSAYYHQTSLCIFTSHSLSAFNPKSSKESLLFLFSHGEGLEQLCRQTTIDRDKIFFQRKIWQERTSVQGRITKDNICIYCKIALFHILYIVLSVDSSFAIFNCNFNIQFNSTRVEPVNIPVCKSTPPDFNYPGRGSDPKGELGRQGILIYGGGVGI